MLDKVLIVDDDRSILTALKMMLSGEYLVHTAENGAEALKVAQEHSPDLILLDIGLPDTSGIDLVESFKKANPDIAVVMITAVGDVKTVVKALKVGAYDYLQKPLDGSEVKVTIRNALENSRLKEQIRRIQQPNLDRYNFDLIGRSAQLSSIVEMVRKAAKSVDTPILITGETGTGKGHLAKAIHYHYSELPGPFVTINCTAITIELFESELFGYERGAFTGASADGKKGRFEEAREGTILLDEIGSMPLSVQSKLLGVLEDRIFHRVGGSKPIKLSSRIIAATNVELERAIEEGGFRRDLFYRLNVVRLNIPPLRERPEDIMPLTKYFLQFYNKKFGNKTTKVSPEAKKVLLSHPWAGNVRELKNALERVTLFEDGDALLPEHFSFLHSGYRATTGGGADLEGGNIDYEEAIRRVLEKALTRSQGNVLEAARLLKMPPHKLRYRIKRYGLDTR